MANSGDRSAHLAIQALNRKVDEQAEQHEALRGSVLAVSQAVTDLAARQKDAKPAPAFWPALHDPERAERWDEFTRWLRDVWVTRHVDHARDLTPCWQAHPTAVDALTSAWLTHVAAHARTADPTQAADWHTSRRPNLAAQVQRALSGCLGAGHHQDDVAIDSDVLEALSEPYRG